MAFVPLKKNYEKKIRNKWTYSISSRFGCMGGCGAYGKSNEMTGKDHISAALKSCN